MLPECKICVNSDLNFHVNCSSRVREIADTSNNWVFLGLGTKKYIKTE